MKKGFLEVLLVGLAALSLGTAGALFAEAVPARPGPLLVCSGSCSLTVNCSSPCVCQVDSYLENYYCALPSQ